MNRYLCLIFIFACVALGEKVKVICDFSADPDVSYIEKSDVQLQVSGGKLLVTTGTQALWPGITIPAPDGVWDLRGYRFVSFDITNTSDEAMQFLMRVDNPGTDGVNSSRFYDMMIDAGQTERLSTELYLIPLATSENLELIGMSTYPSASDKLDPANINRIVLFIPQPPQSRTFEIGNVIAREDVLIIDSSSFLPFVDEFGQLTHIDWSGKVHSAAELASVVSEEQAYINANPGPASFSDYGGWKDGPLLEATGYFRTEKVSGKWWFVDPQGYLFWSHGVNCVDTGDVTPVEGREIYFVSLPDSNSSLGEFYSTLSRGLHGYYSTLESYLGYNFYNANLYRKFSNDWHDDFANQVHLRLRSWGMNTIGNWSDVDVYDDMRTPYVQTIEFLSRPISKSQGYWGPLTDVFDPSFTKMLREQLRRVEPTINSSWCIGVFVHNEISWGNDEVSVALAVLECPPDHACKKVFINDLRVKYNTIDALNAVWGTSYMDWVALLNSTQKPDVIRAETDLKAFYARLANTYFKTIKQQIAAVAPNALYLGGRFSQQTPTVLNAAAKYCDVVSFNHYRTDMDGLDFLDDYDKPVIIGEFHFGATDRGMFSCGIQSARNQTEKSAKYKAYMLDALGEDNVVGASWFQYVDQPLTGRSDAENFAIGLVDVCDRPYDEVRAAVSEIGYGMYQYRSDN